MLVEAAKERGSNSFKKWRKKRKREILAEKNRELGWKNWWKNKVTEEELGGRLSKLNRNFAKINMIKKQEKEKD